MRDKYLFYYFLNFLIIFTSSFEVEELNILKVKAWQQEDLNGFVKETDLFPEKSDPLVSQKPNTAIAFSGGGSRAYVAAIGYLAGLNKLDLIKNIRYIGGISGGSWATAVFTYPQNPSITDEEFLGNIRMPEDITTNNLKEMSENCALSFVNKNVVEIALEALNSSKVSSLSESWAYAIQKVYLDPISVFPDTYFSWSKDVVEDVLKRNPSLSSVHFNLPKNQDRPYPIIGSTLIGPTEGAPYSNEGLGRSNLNASFLEITPIYTGHMKTLDIEYTYAKGVKHTKRTGGLVESIGFPRKGNAAIKGLASSKTSGTLNMRIPEAILDLRYAISASSWAPALFLDSLPNSIPDKIGGMEFDYWSPSDSTPRHKSTLFGDGGDYENMNLISYIQRRVDKIILFSNGQVPLQPSSSWNVEKDAPTGDQISDFLSCFFGVFPTDVANWENRSLNYYKDQVFAQSDWITLVNSLQKAQDAGNGMIATLNLNTVENIWWGIPAGIPVQLTVVYLGRLKSWEDKLSPEMKKLLVPSDPEDASNLAVDIDNGPFRLFPHYTTAGGMINHERANVLADLTAWSVLQNAKTFRNILS